MGNVYCRRLPDVTQFSYILVVQCTIHSTQGATGIFSGTHFSVCSERLAVRAMATALTTSADISAKLSNENKLLYTSKVKCSFETQWEAQTFYTQCAISVNDVILIQICQHKMWLLSPLRTGHIMCCLISRLLCRAETQSDKLPVFSNILNSKTFL